MNQGTDHRMQAGSYSRFREAISKIPLFQSPLEWLAAHLVPGLTRVFRRRQLPQDSHAVEQLTLWERFLSHRGREQRAMTMAISRPNSLSALPPADPHDWQPALTELGRLLRETAADWQNQPLNVVVGPCNRREVMDPDNSWVNSVSSSMIPTARLGFAASPGRACLLRPTPNSRRSLPTLGE